MQRVLLLATANNGLTQRAAAALQRAGNSVRTAVVATESEMLATVSAGDFDLIVCPFLKAKIPSAIWQNWPTVIIHPGAIADRGPSSLDWAITQDQPIWGVTALSATAEMDAGPIWAHRTFEMPEPPIRKSALYNGPVADAAVACILEVVAKVADPEFQPVPLDEAPRPVPSAQLRPTMKQADRHTDWSHDTATIARAVRAADGSPGLLTELSGVPTFVYDARPGRTGNSDGEKPGSVIAKRLGAVEIATGDGSIWIGHARPKKPTATFKLPTVSVLNSAEYDIDINAVPEHDSGTYREISYRASEGVGRLSFEFYHGAMSTAQCERLLAALQYALADDTTKVLVLAGSWEYFSNGVHLNVIEAADSPAHEAWMNIKAINAVCRTIVTAADKVVIGAFTGNAGAGGVMLPLGADIVVAREGTVLNPHYASMGLFGSELHTYTLPRRVGARAARRLTGDCLPIGAEKANDIGLVDEVGPRDQHAFGRWITELALGHTEQHLQEKILTAKREELTEVAASRPLDAYEAHELGEMARDMFDDRNNFAQLRHNFVYKLPG